MIDYSAMIRSTFEKGSVLDAEKLFEIMNTFRRLELIRFLREEEYMEGRSWNHVFEVKKSEWKGAPVWAVQCRRVTMGKSPDKNVYLDYLTLGFVGYME